jgi:hypothetical protein
MELEKNRRNGNRRGRAGHFVLLPWWSAGTGMWRSLRDGVGCHGGIAPNRSGVLAFGTSVSM